MDSMTKERRSSDSSQLENIDTDSELSAEERATARVQIQVALQNNNKKWVGLTEFINDRAEAEWGKLEVAASSESPIVSDLTGEKGAEIDALLEQGIVRKLFASSTRDEIKAEAERSLVGYQSATRKLKRHGLEIGQQPEVIRTYEVSRKGFQKSFGQADFSATTRGGRRVEVTTHDGQTEAVIQGRRTGRGMRLSLMGTGKRLFVSYNTITGCALLRMIIKFLMRETRRLLPRII